MAGTTTAIHPPEPEHKVTVSFSLNSRGQPMHYRITAA